MTLVRFSVRADPELLDALSDCLLSAGAGALEEGPSTLTVYAESPEFVAVLEQAVAEFRERAREALPEFEVHEPEVVTLSNDWQQAWLDHLEAERVTATFTARPTHRPDAPAGERTIWLEPSPAFGEGGHASTRLAAQAVERLALEHPGARLLDVGTGTGLLTLVGLSSGLSSALAIDIEPAAVQAATKNAELNGLAERCTVSSASLDTLQERFDIVVANMIVPTLLELGAALVSRTANDGRLILSGLLAEDADQLTASFAGLGAHEVLRTFDGDWCSLEFTLTRE